MTYFYIRRRVVVIIYLDHSATTPLCGVAKKAILEHLDDFGNPSSSYELGRQSRLLIEDARERISKCINAEPEEIFFVSGGSEANSWITHNWQMLTSEIEHHSLKGWPCLNVNNNGIIDSVVAQNNIDDWTSKVWVPNLHAISCMMVNNELGTIQPVKEIAKIVHDKSLYFHTDAVQALGHISIDVKNLDVDMLSGSGHKFGGLRGAGFLYVKKGLKISPLIKGGKQEQGMRGGTENVLGIIAMAAALDDAVEHMEKRNNHIKRLRDKMLDHLLKIEGGHLNGSLENRVVSNINIRFDGVLGSRLVALCDLYGVCISSGSACNEGIAKPSHVLKAIGLSDEEALNSIRITIGHENTEEEIDIAAEIIISLVERIRKNEE